MHARSAIADSLANDVDRLFASTVGRVTGRGLFIETSPRITSIAVDAARLQEAVVIEPDATRLEQYEGMVELRHVLTLNREPLIVDREVTIPPASFVLMSPTRFAPRLHLHWQIAVAQRATVTGGQCFVLAEKGPQARYLARVFAEVAGGTLEVVGKGRTHRLLRATFDAHSVVTWPSLRSRRTISVADLSFEVETGLTGFASGGLDEGTRRLIEATDFREIKSLLDIGCGWGPIGLIAALKNITTHVTMLDSDLRSIAIAQTNANQLGIGDRTRTMHADSIIHVTGRVDHVLANPPLHISADARYHLLSGLASRLVGPARARFVVQKGYADSVRADLVHQFMDVHDAVEMSEYVVLDARVATIGSGHESRPLSLQ